MTLKSLPSITRHYQTLSETIWNIKMIECQRELEAINKILFMEIDCGTN